MTALDPETLKSLETLLSRRDFPCFPQSQFGGILLTKSECWVLELPSTTRGECAPLSGDRDALPSLALRPRAIPMDERDYRDRDNDSDRPTMPGIRVPGDIVGAGALTPPPLSNPPLSDAPTLAHGSPIPSAALPYIRSGPPSVGGISAFQSLQPGVLFGGRYEILGVLGQGGMGAVYKARDRELDRLIALKVIRPELATDPAILLRFKQELILSRNITHKNVVRIYDLGEADGIRFISMEYVDGEDLRTILRRQGKFSPKEAITVVEQVCRALDSAHSEGVIHRDLKPQNIMPDQRPHIFSVGLIFYELLTGKAPYEADTAIASLMKRTREEARSASDVDASVPKSLSAIVSRCLEREPRSEE